MNITRALLVEIVISGAFLLFPFGALAQSGAVAQQNELIQQLLQRINQLEKRVSELELEKHPVQTAVSPPAQPVEAPAAVASAISQSAVPSSMHDHDVLSRDSTTTYPSLRISGFGDINYSGSDRPGTHSGFHEGQFILHLSSALSSRVSYFGELSLTARSDAGLGSPPASGFDVEVERSIIRYDQSDHLKLSFGRYHTPISYWNTEFHHGSWLQTTTSRPEMIEFGGSFIPVHFVGALAEGSFTTGGLNLNYNLGIGNGRSSVLSRAGDFGDINNNKAWLATVFVKPDWAYGLQVGASVYRDKVTVANRPETREWIQSAHVVWAKENPEFIAEFFNISHQQPGSAFVSNSQAFYAQVAERLSFAPRWKPYYRYEYIHTPASDVLFNGRNLGVSSSNTGVRFDISSFAAFKFEWRNQNRPHLPNANVGWVQTSFTF